MKRLNRPTVIVMAIKPKYAKAIYEGRKTWEFRKAPPPLYTRIFLYESAPVSAITGWVYFCESITGVPGAVFDMVKHAYTFGKNLPGITQEELKQYAGKRLVTALHVLDRCPADRPICFTGKPPQNWARYGFSTTPAEGDVK